MATPEECTHAEVLVGVEMTAARWPGSGAEGDALIQQGRCEQCGSQVTRRGAPDAWAPWLLSSSKRYRWG
jgi:hypothetical protein